MNRRRALGIAIAFTVVGLIVGLTLSSNLGFQSKAYTGNVSSAVTEERPVVSQGAFETLSKVSDAMVELVTAVRPSVVNIATSRKVIVGGVGTQNNPMFNDPFFRRFFGEDMIKPFDGPRERKESGLGSGVIVDKGGYIVTNNHVVREAEEITVTLYDKREFKGKVIGTDPKTDIAVIKIEASGLPAIKWGDSDKLRVGEMVVAVGSPYGLSQTVTSGIVSAKGRANVRIADYEDFIQTDAAINPGNSGGPLINVAGELVGINTAIFSTSGGYQGIGFSIPSKMIRQVMDSLMKDGKVVRGWLGVTIQPLSKDMAEQFGIKDEKGAIVSDVGEGSPAERAGIESGDLIVEFDGKPVDDPAALRTIVAAMPPGAKVTIKILRDGKPKTITVEIGELKDDQTASAPVSKIENALRGVKVQNITPELREKLDIPQRLSGVVVVQVDEDRGTYMKAGDLILEVNKVKVKNVKEYVAVVSDIKPGKNILLRVFRGGGIVFLIIPG